MTKWLKGIRGSYGLQQLELANMLGVSRSAVGMYETGAPVPVETVARIVEIFPDAPPAPVGELEIMPVPRQPESASILYAGVVPRDSDWSDPLLSDEQHPVDPKFAGTRRFKTRITGNSAYPALMQGDEAYWEVDKAPPYGVVVLAENKETCSCTLAVLSYDEATGANLLMPINPKAKLDTSAGKLAIIARLIGVVRLGDGAERTWRSETGLRPEHLLVR